MRFMACLLLLIGCPGPEPLPSDAGAVIDAGAQPVDAGSARPDASAQDSGVDAGQTPDTGASSIDAGGTPDSGQQADAGLPEAGAQDAGLPNDCVTLMNDLGGLLRDLRSCQADSECGQPMHGTSCGCTRDMVARLDADLTWFNALRRRGNLLGCNMPFASTCDCPEADGFVCNEGFCNWNYVR